MRIPQSDWEKKIKRKGGMRDIDRLRIHEKDGVVFLTFPLLDEFDAWLLNGFSTRIGGVSGGVLSSMNLSRYREKIESPDDPEGAEQRFQKNVRRFASAVGFEPEDAVFSAQMHTTNVMEVHSDLRGCGTVKYNPIENTDGMMTDERRVALMTFYADCVPLLIVDPEHRAIAASHSGWRGTVADMGGVTVRKMQERYGSDPAKMTAVIGPSIGKECYEVSEDVIEKFRAAYPQKLWPLLFEKREAAGTAESDCLQTGTAAAPASTGMGDTAGVSGSSAGPAAGGQKYLLDLHEACRQNFLRAGIPFERISLPDICTACNPDFLFSHRASRGRRGLLGAVIMLR